MRPNSQPASPNLQWVCRRQKPGCSSLSKIDSLWFDFQNSIVFACFCIFFHVLMLIPCSWLLVCCVFVSSFLFATSECFRDFAKQDNSYIYVTCGLFLKSSFMICNMFSISMIWLNPWICLTIDGFYLLTNLKNVRCRDRYDFIYRIWFRI